jgi:hypothetical protein
MSQDAMFPALDAMFRDANVQDIVRDEWALATANVARIQAMRGEGIRDVDIVRKMIEGADLVIGVFADETQPYGVGRHVIKGQRLLMTIGAERKDKSGRLECIYVTCREEAAALQQVFGEPDALN